MQPIPDSLILDVGVGTEYHSYDNFLEKHYPFPHRLVGIGLDDLRPICAKYPKSDFVTASGLALPFPDKAFDIVHSNAVIEHIIGKDERYIFVSECLRVGKSTFLTTPNAHFPVEVHTRYPFVHWLPVSLSNRILSLTGKRWALRGSYFEPLSAKDLLDLFPPDANCQIIGIRTLSPIAETLVAIARSPGAPGELNAEHANR